MTENTSERFDENKSLLKFLQDGDTDITRNIIGKSFFRRHCEQKMIKIQEIHHIIYPNGRLVLSPLRGELFYCLKCGIHRNNYPWFI